MTNPFRDSEDYELFLYTVEKRFPSIRRSTLILVRLGASLARVSGELHFDNDIRLVVRERLVYHRLPVVTDWYGYEVWQREKKLYWYDSQPHPHEPELQITHPHHKHIPPDIKHNRIPAAEMSFHQPNLLALIHEIEEIIREKDKNN